MADGGRGLKLVDVQILEKVSRFSKEDIVWNAFIAKALWKKARLHFIWIERGIISFGIKFLPGYVPSVERHILKRKR